MAVEVRRRGGTLDEVGAALGVGRERARQILLQAKQNQGLPSWIQGLDVRTAKILLAQKYGSRRDVQAAMERGEYIARIGPTRLQALRLWLEGDEHVPECGQAIASDGSRIQASPQEDDAWDKLPEGNVRLSGIIMAYPDRLLDTVMDYLNLKNDAALCRVLGVAPPMISKIRRRGLPLGPAVLLRLLEATGLSIRELFRLMKDRAPWTQRAHGE